MANLPSVREVLGLAEKDVPLDKQPRYQATITMQVTGHAADAHNFREKMVDQLRDEGIAPFVANGHLHGSLDQFQVVLVRDLQQKESPTSHQALIAVDIQAGDMSTAECVGMEAAGRVAEKQRYVQGTVTTARMVNVTRR